MHREPDNLWAALDFSLRQPSEAAAGAALAEDLFAHWPCRGPGQRRAPDSCFPE